MKQNRLKQFLCLLFFLLWCASRNLALMQEYAASRGAQLLFVCAPNKNTVYPKFMPARYVRSTSERNLDRLLASLREQGVPFCDVRDVLRNANSLTYYRTDSHWNGYGSALAHNQILSALGRDSVLASEAFTMQPHRGDLFEMLYPASSRTEDGPALAHARSFSYADDFHAADDQRIRTSSAASGSRSVCGCCLKLSSSAAISPSVTWCVVGTAQ